MNRKICAIAIILALLLTSAGMVYAVTPPDVQGTEYQTAVDLLIEKEIITGSTDGNFYPEATLTRAQACVMMVKAAGLPLEEGVSGFQDMNGYGWAEPYVKAAVEYGIVAGYEDRTFRPGKSVTSNELVTFVLRAAGHSDASLSGTWPSNYVNKGAEEGLYESLPETMPREAAKWMAAQMVYNGLTAIEEAQLVKVVVLEDTLPDLVDIGAVVVPDMTFQGTAVKLSLEEAIQRMKTTGPGLEAAILARDALATAAKSSSETWKNLKELSSTNTKEGKIVEISKVYYADQALIRYDISLNDLEASAVQSYFGFLQAQENLRIAQENVAIKETTLKNVKRKYSLGVAARVEVNTATSDLLSAQVTLNQATATFANARMAFNIQMNYPLMQNVQLTDELEKKELPDISLSNAIKAALANRNEITVAKYEKDVAQIEMNSVSAYPRTSATYLGAMSDLKAKQIAYDQTFLNIEMEIRSKYMDLLNLSKAVDSSQRNVENAREAVRIANLSYNAGLNTLTDVNSAETAYYMAQLAYSKAVTDLNQAIYQFEFAIGKGTGSAA